MCEQRLGNLLGAVALAATDAMRDAAERAVGHGGETPAALVAIGHVPGLSNDQLARALGLSHAGCVRVVDRLATSGWVERRPDERDRRAVSLHLTEQGAAQRAEILRGRADALARLVPDMPGERRALFESLLCEVLLSLPRDPLHGLRICRLCDNGACADCPIDAAVAPNPAAPAG